MLILILFMFAALPPVIAAKGKLYRGLWFALCAIALAIGSLFFLVDIASTRASDPNSVTPQDVASSLMLLRWPHPSDASLLDAHLDQGRKNSGSTHDLYLAGDGRTPGDRWRGL